MTADPCQACERRAASRSEPTELEAARGEAEPLLDFAITRWWLDDEVRRAWQALPLERALQASTARFAGTRHLEVRSRLLELSAAVGPPADALVRRAWDEHPEGGWFWSLIEATAACLPFREGFDRGVAALGAMPWPERRNALGALAHFRSPETLRWIEANVREPVAESWGALAAASSFGWPDAARWLDAGRPLNLVAIDALLAIGWPRSPYLQAIRPVLAGAPDERAVAAALRRAIEADPAPRVRQRVEALLARLPTLLRPGDAAPGA